MFHKSILITLLLILSCAQIVHAERKLYQNDGSGGLTPVTLTVVTEASTASYSGSWCDYDNDGHLDLFVANSSAQNNELYHNNGDGTFTAITEGIVVNDGTASTCGVWGDYDRGELNNLFRIISRYL